MSRHIRLHGRLLAVTALAVSLAACDIAVNGDGGLQFDIASGRAQDEWTRSYKVAAGGRLEVINVNGRITAEASDGETVEIRAERTAKARSDDAARDLLKQIEMREEAGESRIRIEVRAPRMRGTTGHEIKWTIRVPRSLSVDLRTINGGVTLTGLAGDVRARATNGGITGRQLTATAVDAAVTNGGVEIEMARPIEAGNFDLESVNGGVALILPSQSKATIAARCVNGGISVSGLELAVDGEQTRRRIDGRLNGGGANVTLETVNGGVRLAARNTT